MQIGILTFHHAHNYGAVLQAYALKKYVESLGHEVEIVNYQNKKIASTYPKTLLPRFGASTLLPKNWKQYIYDFLRGIYGNKEWKSRWQQFDRFIGKQLLGSKESQAPLSSYPVISAEEMKEISKDIWLLGSDQIWSSFLLGYLDPVYFGANRKKGKTISYAASMLHAELAEGEEEEFRSLLENVDVISVREEQLAGTLRDLSGRAVETTCDPTLLLDAEDFSSLYEDVRPMEESYVFAYFVVEEALVEEYARAIAAKLGIRLMELHYSHMPENSGEGCHADFGPAEFLQYIKHAECVVTNSFHGTVFSILFQKKFYSVFWKNGRVSNLLETLGLEQRIYTKSEQLALAIERLNDEIPYESVNEKRLAYRSRSQKFLQDHLSI